jgi:hypothetical protein
VILANVLLALTIGSGAAKPDAMLSGDSLMAELKKGGYTILWRHTATNMTNMDAAGFPKAWLTRG